MSAHDDTEAIEAAMDIVMETALYGRAERVVVPRDKPIDAMAFRDRVRAQARNLALEIAIAPHRRRIVAAFAGWRDA